MTFTDACQRVLAGAKVIHETWPRQGYRCYLFAHAGDVWIHHSDGSEHPVGEKYKQRYGPSGGWTDELID